jgi:hypothetical protein
MSSKLEEALVGRAQPLNNCLWLTLCVCLQYHASNRNAYEQSKKRSHWLQSVPVTDPVSGPPTCCERRRLHQQWASHSSLTRAYQSSRGVSRCCRTCPRCLGSYAPLPHKKHSLTKSFYRLNERFKCSITNIAKQPRIWRTRLLVCVTRVLTRHCLRRPTVHRRRPHPMRIHLLLALLSQHLLRLLNNVLWQSPRRSMNHLCSWVVSGYVPNTGVFTIFTISASRIQGMHSINFGTSCKECWTISHNL